MATSNRYLDTCALLDWALMPQPRRPDRDAAGGRILAYAADSEVQLAISEFTLVEGLDHCSRSLMDGHSDSAQHDDAWWAAMRTQLMMWIEDETIIVVPTPPSFAESAIRLVEYVTRSKQRQLRALDAAHLIAAMSWARSLGETVVFSTADNRLAAVFTEMPELETHLSVEDLRNS